jgi:NAD(P)H-dependent FMN reductase
MKVIAFAGSNSKNSINKKLAIYAAKQFKNAEVEILDLNDFELPLFSVDREKEMGHPQLAQDFLNKISSSDLLVVSLLISSLLKFSVVCLISNLFIWIIFLNF